MSTGRALSTSKNQPVRPATPPRPARGPGGRMAFERPRDTRRVAMRLLQRLRSRQLLLLAVFALVLMSSGSMLASNYYLKPLINDYILPGDFQGLRRGLLFLAAIRITGVVATWGQNRLMITVAQRTSNGMRIELFEKLQSMPLSYLDAHPHGELMSRFTNDIDSVQMAFEQSLIQLVSSTINFCGALVMTVVLNPVLFTVSAVVVGMMSLVTRKLGARSRSFFQAQHQALGEVNAYVEELIEGLKVVKVFGHEDAAMAEFQERNEAYRQAATGANFFAAIAFPISGNLNNIGYAATALLGGVLAVRGRFDIGSLAAFLQYQRQIGFPMQQITNQFNIVLAALAGAERVFDVLDQPSEVDEGVVERVDVGPAVSDNGDGARANGWAWRVPQPTGEAALVPLRGDVRFHNVTFAYKPGQPVLHDISLYAKPGQKIAFVGSTGAGKTTITNLISRFYDVEHGSITFDGIDIRDIRKDSLRGSIGMVLQDTHLFTGTVMDNIRYGRLNATDEECIAAAKQANAHSFIRRLPQGYQTEITADGANLSQGQRQLLAIARAAVADPPVMVLDEATSSVDTRTERLIEKGLDALMAGRTVFVIAHRLSTVRNADAIIVIEGGRIIERGDHDDLLEQKGRYYQLYIGQFELD